MQTQKIKNLAYSVISVICKKKPMILIIKVLHLEDILICSLKLNQKHLEETLYRRNTNKRKIVQIKEKLDLCDIRKIRNPNMKHYTFCQQHSSGYFQRRLNYFFISVLQESVKIPDVLGLFSTDHSPIMFSVFSKSEGTR